MFNIPTIKIIVFIYNFLCIRTMQNECSINGDNNCSSEVVDNKYTKEFNERYTEFLQAIKAAKESYRPCNNTKCNCHTQVIANDLKTFSRGISKINIDNVRTKGTKYQILNHHLYRDKACMFPARCSGIDHFLLKLLPKLPDMELIINTRDWPQIHKRQGVFGPVFSFSKSEEYYDIMYPAWSFWEGGPAIGLYPRGIGRWDLHQLQLSKVANETTWEKKLTKAFFRGSRTSSERDSLVLLSRENPDLVDAQYTKNQAWKSDADTLHAPPAPEVSFIEHCKYKYLFNFRGVAASFRFKHILLCKSLVFHVGNEWLEFFYPALKPWIHYIPVDINASKEDIKQLIQFAIENDKLSKEIAENGYQMIWENLKMKDITCYWKKLLNKYAKLLSFSPDFDKDLIEILQK